MHLILTGATGLVGSAVLNHIINSSSSSSSSSSSNSGAASQITKVTILSRNPSIPILQTHQPPANIDIDVIPHTDFLTYPAPILSSVADAEGIIWALGISQNLVSPDEYVTITRDYAVAAAKALASNPAKQAGKPFKFVFVSGQGATATPGRFTPLFSRVKGETETALLALNASAQCPDLRVYSARPGAVDGHVDPAVMAATKMKTRTGFRKFERYLMPLFRALYPDMVNPTRELAIVLTDLALRDGDSLPDGPGIGDQGRTIGSLALRKMAGL